MLILPDHPTPVSVKTHTADPVPYLLYDSRKQEERDCVYNEAEALRQGNLIQEGYRLIEKLFERIEKKETETYTLQWCFSVFFFFC